MEISLYREIESKTARNFNLRCIDGSIHGCGKCVGYCTYDGHSGFLTAQMQKEHQCIEKGCFYHYPKPRGQKRLHDDNKSLQKKVFSAAQVATAAMEGLRVIRVSVEPNQNCVIFYAAIAEYDILPVAEKVTASTECQIRMEQIQCDFDVAVALVMS